MSPTSDLVTQTVAWQLCPDCLLLKISKFFVGSTQIINEIAILIN